MSKLIAALVLLSILSIAYAKPGCALDTCNGKPSDVSFPSMCGPCHYYYVCIRMVIVYRWCSASNLCVINGHCRPCGDTCEGKPNGLYQSVNRPRPAYYQCDFGELYYRECESFQVFNPWTRKCECFEGVCLQGNGWRISFCRGKGWRVLCRGGFPVKYRRCPQPRPYVCCVTYQCVASCGTYLPGNRCCNN
ncbi:hypothetical protein LSAT2_017311 [Lamellibrachia satsuma]|nr:hypothetical protein LSAT2_017311 [Lamellibrachia satsuma]